MEQAPKVRRGRKPGRRTTTLEEKFAACVLTPGPLDTPCLIWTSWIDGEGYGQVRINKVAYYAHRLSYEKSIGPIPNGLCVCHRCDVRSCVNPAHLFVGTRADNMRDMYAKGRGWGGFRHMQPECRARGDSHKGSKLTTAAVLEMRARRAAGVPLCDLAAKFGITKGVASRAVNGRTWKHIPTTPRGEVQ